MKKNIATAIAAINAVLALGTCGAIENDTMGFGFAVILLAAFTVVAFIAARIAANEARIEKEAARRAAARAARRAAIAENTMYRRTVRNIELARF